MPDKKKKQNNTGQLCFHWEPIYKISKPLSCRVLKIWHAQKKKKRKIINK